MISPPVERAGCLCPPVLCGGRAGVRPHVACQALEESEHLETLDYDPVERAMVARGRWWRVHLEGED